MKAVTWQGNEQLSVEEVPDPRLEEPVEYADVPDGGTVAVFGLGPVGQFCSRIARHKGHRVIAVELVPERLELARRHGIETVDAAQVDDVSAVLREMTQGRGPDAVIDAVGMEAHGSPFGALAQRLTGLLPDRIAAPAAERFGVDRLSSLLSSIDAVRRGGTVSVIGVYGGAKDPLPMMDLFDKGVQLRMGQAHVKRWVPEILALLSGDDDPLGTEDLTTHRLPLAEAPHGYDIFQKKQDGCIKVVLEP